MIPQLYEPFKHWSAAGSVWIISDPHFDDPDCEYMDKHWITPEEHIAILNKRVYKNDTLVCLGDCGNLEWFDKIKGYKVLIKGNHDDKAKELYKRYFDEVYDGPLFISPKILLSHEPIYGLDFCLNIHGHLHDKIVANIYHKSVVANLNWFEPLNLGREIKRGILGGIDNIHRVTIDRAVERKENEK